MNKPFFRAKLAGDATACPIKTNNAKFPIGDTEAAGPGAYRRRLKTAIRGGFAASLALSLTWRAMAGPAFTNLNFGSARIVPAKPGDYSEIVASSALPGWTVYYGATPQSTIGYDQTSIENANASLFDSACRTGAPSGFTDGGYYLLLQEGDLGSSMPGDTPPWVAVSIAQTAEIPPSANTLTFRASVAQFTVFFGSTLLPVTVQSSHQGFDIYDCDISALAGQTGELRFTACDPTVYLDDIQFLSSAVPEPGSLGLLGAGALMVSLIRGGSRP
jgi:hypothetical protein